MTTTQEQKAQQLHKLHHSGRMLVLPNIWDPLSSVLLESLKYQAIATASASISFTNGYKDGEFLPFENLLINLQNIVDSVSIPVTADIESGYAANDLELAENIKRIIATGVVGINIEDTDKKTGKMLPIEVQSAKIRLIRKVASEMGISLFINARTDVYIHSDTFDTAQSKLDETLKRGFAYKAAGADCFYPIVMKTEHDIQSTVETLKMPINILTLPGIPDLQWLNDIGVARVSLGPSFLKIAIKAMRDLAVKLQNFDGLSEITSNDITSDYLKNLVDKDKI